MGLDFRFPKRAHLVTAPRSQLREQMGSSFSGGKRALGGFPLSAGRTPAFAGTWA